MPIEKKESTESEEGNEVAAEATQEVKPKDTGFTEKMKELDEIYGTVDKRIQKLRALSSKTDLTASGEPDLSKKKKKKTKK